MPGPFLLPGTRILQKEKLMNCEQVEKRLSAYLDNVLTRDERREIAIHLQNCPHCMMLLAELRQNDILLAQLPRISPDPVLGRRLFSSPEMLALTGTLPYHLCMADEWTRPLAPRSSERRASHPHLVALPGGRSSLSRLPAVPPTPPTIQLRPDPPQERPGKQHLRLIKGALPPLFLLLSLLLLLVGGVAGLIGLRTHSEKAHTGRKTAVLSLKHPGEMLPLTAGTRFVFLRDGTLWDALLNGNPPVPERLTPPQVTVGNGWIISPARPEMSASDMLAYIDMHSATLHVVHCNGEEDITVPQALMKAGSTPGSVWDTASGSIILSGLAWSPDGSTLAFVGDPTNSGITSLYLYPLATHHVQTVSPGIQGSVSHPSWSPDGTHLVFEVAHDQVVSLVGYNVQDQDILNISNLAATDQVGINSPIQWSTIR